MQKKSGDKRSKIVRAAMGIIKDQELTFISALQSLAYGFVCKVTVDPMWQPKLKSSCMSNCSKDFPNVLHQNILKTKLIGHLYLQRIVGNFSIVVVMKKRMDIVQGQFSFCSTKHPCSFIFTKKNINFPFP